MFIFLNRNKGCQIGGPRLFMLDMPTNWAVAENPGFSAWVLLYGQQKTTFVIWLYLIYDTEIIDRGVYCLVWLHSRA